MSTPAFSATKLQYGSRYDHENEEKKAHFSLYSVNATRIELCLFRSPRDAKETDRYEMIRTDQSRWKYTLSPEQTAQFRSVIYYGYRCWGPNWTYDSRWKPGNAYGFITDCDNDGNRFNPNKLLIDPWTTEISHDPAPRLSRIIPNEYDDAYYSGEEFRTVDTGRIAPKSMLVLHPKTVSLSEKPLRPFKDDIIYELHIRGFTCQDTWIPETYRGTYRGAGLKAAYLKDLGITAVELLPVHHFANEQNDDGDPSGDNYTGYMTFGYFAPNRRYASDRSPGGPTREFREMVNAFHEQGIKVFIDVDFSHTGEGLLKRVSDDPESRDDDYRQYPDRACLLSLRGIDNASYYTLRSSSADHGALNQRYQDNSLCGANLNVTSPVVRTLIFDVVKYWSNDMRVDGFRFGHAPVLGSTMKSDGFYFNIKTGDDLLTALAKELPVRSASAPSGVDLVAEPLTGGSGNTLQLAQFPDGWAEWNDVYRTIIRQLENKFRVVDVPPRLLANAVAGSEHEFRHGSPRREPCPWHSVNYVTSHAGHTLRDVFSYTSDDDSWDHGGIPQQQRKAVRNAVAILMTSAGVPLITAGDELYRTLGGRTDVTALDEKSVYLDWDGYNRYAAALAEGRTSLIEEYMNDDAVLIYRFMRAMTEFRSRYASLRPESYFTGLDISGKGIRDITWYGADGREIAGADWNRPGFLGWRIDNQEYVQPGDTGSFYIACNWNDSFTECILPQPVAGMQWRRYADTAEWLEYAANCDGNRTELDISYGMHARSVLVAYEQ